MSIGTIISAGFALGLIVFAAIRYSFETKKTIKIEEKEISSTEEILDETNKEFEE